ncbi:MAG: DegT/DnrJ/EryC1/StrS family aminotransferase [Flavobacteriales bacterium]|nr:DegT/DnrJ/EryC1/StrS family aminotransferase [Flavobacteriales bacterium]MCB0778049.1 DegT/DnrJ/EryC1/StrS family aminotransferase [Flavobacteriales bacterium]MCB0807673.1 DegT/DnrJ/EryC1/StrS family aminotransferase [Flavobacteriales bacterium]
MDPRTFCVDSEKVLERIRPHTTAILATIIYGIPCEVDRSECIAKCTV